MSTRSYAAGAAALITAGVLTSGVATSVATASPASQTSPASQAPTTTAPAGATGSTTAGIAGPAGAQAEPSRPTRRAAKPYRLSLVAPARLADGTSTRAVDTVAVGIGDTGLVAGNAGTADSPAWTTVPFVHTGSARWLDGDVDETPYDARVTAVSPRGAIAGRVNPPGAFVVRWSGAVRPERVAAGAADDSAYHTVFDVSARGAMVGCATVYRVGMFQRWDARGAVSSLASDRSGNCENAAMANDGSAVGTMSAPMMKSDGIYPNAVSITARGVTRLPMPSPTTVSTADAMSPNGRWIIGRTGPAGAEPTRPVILSRTALPRALRGAGMLVPKAVNDAGVVVGSHYGHATTWSRNRLVDLTSQTAGLPRGWVLTDAVAINARGDIAANALDPATERTVAVKLTANRR